ncbi:hypothetical protein WBP06_20020 [Novosphingobium sp. BL-8H]|uniref:hypothetical protein n=1 Tax=Novosphingobium sp. BL-8H TaxID=3127640 RepID=UPI0037565346
MATEHDANRNDQANLFSAQECSVLALAARDPAGSIAFDKKRTRGWRAFVFGKPYNYCLANDKLEVLRVTAVLLRGGHFPAEQFYRFRLAGYSRDQFDAIAAHYAPASALSAATFDLPDYAEPYAEAA